ncbi:transmembrane channel-like protein 5 isoform X2 [Macrosteles quadrilineatus]|nr:transmembrane channel-like protein 5 isoform X2 [Macrosteles quadrilineatus]
MDDTPLAEKLRLEALREMPQNLTVKRTVKVKLTNTVSMKSKRRPMSCWKLSKYRVCIFFSRLHLTMRDVFSSWELWYSSLKEIEGHFGSGVAAYFKFLRWLFLMNLFVFFISLCFVVVPNLIQHRAAAQNRSSSLVELLTSVRQTSVDDNSFGVGNTDNRSDKAVYVPFKLGNVFTGEGYFTNSSLYYGYYTSLRELDPKLQSGYSVPKAYFITALLSYAVTFIVISVGMASSYRKSFIETAGGIKNIYAHKVFCGWDFSIATEKAAKLKAESLARELKELMEDDARAVLLQLDWWNDLYVKIKRCLVSALFLVLSGATGCLVYALLTHSFLAKLNSQAGDVIEIVLDEETSVSTAGDSIAISFVITSILILLPMLFSYLVRFEEYHRPRVSLYVTMVRTFLLELIVVAVLVVFWLQRQDFHLCWETSLGQEVYRLVMTDLLLAVLATTLAETVRARLVRRVWPSVAAPAFDLSRNTLNLIHNQTLFWVGFFFSPLLSMVMVIKMFLTFYIKKFGVLNNCEPSSRSWRASQTETLFLVFTFIALLGVLVTYGYIITRVNTSACGPFQGKTYMYEKILEDAFQVEEGNEFWYFLMFLTKPGVVAGVLLTMCAGVYYLRAQSNAQMKMVEILREMLHAESRDKEYLLEKLSYFTGGRKSQKRHSRLSQNTT